MTGHAMRPKSFFFQFKGFTLVELMVTVAILAFGIITIYEALFVSVDTFGFYVNYLDTQDWIDEKIYETQAKLTKSKVLDDGKTSGQFVRDRKTFDWTMMVIPIGEQTGLYKIDLMLAWKQGRKKVSSSRVAYLIPPQLVEYNEENFL